MKHKKPPDFNETYCSLMKESKLSVNSIAKYYKVSSSTVKRWLKEENLIIEKKNERQENYVDMKKFKEAIESGDYSIKEICELFNMNNRNVIEVCKRNIIIQNFRPNLFDPTNKEDFIKDLKQYGKQETARKYKTTLATINGWCKRNNFSLPKYHGRKRNDLEENLDAIIKMYLFGYSLSFIGGIYKTSNTKIRRLLEENGIEVVTTFDKWNGDKTFIKNNIETYIEENKSGLSLKDISLKHNISYEQLKGEFVSNDIDVVLHSYNKSKGEIEVKDFLISLGFDVKSIKRNVDGFTFEIDCFIDDKNFGIEYCGEYWHSVNSGTEKGYHYNKFLWAKKQNITLMTIFENEWYKKKDLLKSMIKARLGLIENKIYARKTMSYVIPNSVAKKFHDENHINGGLKTSSINIGLFYKDRIVSVASFSKSRFTKDAEYELLRFSTIKDFTVVGGFSKILKCFLETQNASSIVSYCDLRFGEGEVYSKSGFRKTSTTPPNYWYYFKSDGTHGKLESRIKYQKHKLKMFSNYSENKSEYEIMSENGYLKIYDCGNYKYLYGA
jgi:predicted transcriptional regulator